MSVDDHGRDGERLSLVPSIRQDADLSRYRFDPETESLLAMMDGRRSIADIAELAGVDADTAVDRMERLSLAGLVAAEPEADGLTGAPHSEAGAVPAVAMFEDAARQGFSGAIRFRKRDVVITVHFDKGAPQAVSSDNPAHDPAAMLAAAGRIDGTIAAAYRDALAAGADGPTLALFRAGVTDRKQLGRLLTWHGSMVLKEICSWTGFESTALPDEPFPARLGRCPLVVPRKAPAARIHADWRERELDEAEERRLEQSRPRYMVAAPQARRIVSGFGLTDREQRLVDHLLEHPTQVVRALAISTAFRSVTRRLLARLIAAGAFELHDTNPAGDTPHDLDDLDPCARRMARENHFDRLTVHAISSPEEIRERYRKRLHEFDPARYPRADEGQRRALEEIRGHLDAAFAVLSDQQLRREYRRQVHGKDQIRNFLDLQLRKAEVALKMRDDPEGALALAESVLDIDPSEVTGLLLKASALARLGEVSRARAILASFENVPPRLAEELNDIHRLAGLSPPAAK